MFQAKSGAENLYEAMFLYGLWINHSTHHGLDVKNGVAWLEFTKNKSFNSTLSDMSFILFLKHTHTDVFIIIFLIKKSLQETFV